MTREVELAPFMKVVVAVRTQFPSLHTKLATEHSHVDAVLEIPAQQGLAFPISINLQSDELHLNVAHFWCEWLPCGDPEVSARFSEALCGLLSGAYRVLEYSRRGVALKSHLQRTANGGWQHVASSHRPHVPVSWGMSTKIIQNVPCG